LHTFPSTTNENQRTNTMCGTTEETTENQRTNTMRGKDVGLPQAVPPADTSVIPQLDLLEALGAPVTPAPLDAKKRKQGYISISSSQKPKRAKPTHTDGGFTDEMTLQPTLKRSHSPYISKRIERLAGLTVGQALQGFMFEDRLAAEDLKDAIHGGSAKFTALRLYRYADLKYDISSGYLVDPRAPELIALERRRQASKRMKAKARKLEAKSEEYSNGIEEEDTEEKAEHEQGVSLAGLNVGDRVEVLWRDAWYGAKIVGNMATDASPQGGVSACPEGGASVYPQGGGPVCYDVLYDEDNLVEMSVPIYRLRHQHRDCVFVLHSNSSALTSVAKVGAALLPSSGGGQPPPAAAVRVAAGAQALRDENQQKQASLMTSNQPDLPSGTRVEIEFEDPLDDIQGAAAANKYCFDGIILRQHETGTVVQFDDGDVQDLDLNVTPFGVLKSQKVVPKAMSGLQTKTSPSASTTMMSPSASTTSSAAVPAAATAPATPTSGVVAVTVGGTRKQPRGPCMRCSGCITPNCGECKLCKDMVRFGGPGRLKQRCDMRVCTGADGAGSSDTGADGDWRPHTKSNRKRKRNRERSSCKTVVCLLRRRPPHSAGHRSHTVGVGIGTACANATGCKCHRKKCTHCRGCLGKHCVCVEILVDPLNAHHANGDAAIVVAPKQDSQMVAPNQHPQKAQKADRMLKRPLSMPRRPSTAYNIFCAVMRPKLTTETRASSSNCERLLGKMWNALSKSSSEVYKVQAASSRANYYTQVERWRQDNPLNAHNVDGDAASVSNDIDTSSITIDTSNIDTSNISGTNTGSESPRDTTISATVASVHARFAGAARTDATQAIVPATPLSKEVLAALVAEPPVGASEYSNAITSQDRAELSVGYVAQPFYGTFDSDLQNLQLQPEELMVKHREEHGNVALV
jgi:hypothetical protein